VPSFWPILSAAVEPLRERGSLDERIRKESLAKTDPVKVRPDSGALGEDSHEASGCRYPEGKGTPRVRTPALPEGTEPAKSPATAMIPKSLSMWNLEKASG
jgi:hypothetical protein